MIEILAGDNTNRVIMELLQEIGLNPNQCGDFTLSFPVAGVVTGQFNMFMTPSQIDTLRASIAQKPQWKAEFNILLMNEDGTIVSK